VPVELTGLTGPGAAGPGPAEAQIAGELDDALYYLRRGCVPCAERHLDLARRHGATAQQVDAVVAAARARQEAPAGPA
jgi:Carboxymuconolactone decarboxylase family